MGKLLFFSGLECAFVAFRAPLRFDYRGRFLAALFNELLVDAL